MYITEILIRERENSERVLERRARTTSFINYRNPLRAYDEGGKVTQRKNSGRTAWLANKSAD